MRGLPGFSLAVPNTHFAGGAVPRQRAEGRAAPGTGRSLTHEAAIPTTSAGHPDTAPNSPYWYRELCSTYRVTYIIRVHPIRAIHHIFLVPTNTFRAPSRSHCNRREAPVTVLHVDDLRSVSAIRYSTFLALVLRALTPGTGYRCSVGEPLAKFPSGYYPCLEKIGS